MLEQEQGSVAPILNSIKGKIVSAFKVADEVMRGKAVETIEYEVEELDNIFAILVLGAFIGIPSPPIHITMQLFPEMEHSPSYISLKFSRILFPFFHQNGFSQISPLQYDFFEIQFCQE